MSGVSGGERRWHLWLRLALMATLAVAALPRIGLDANPQHLDQARAFADGSLLIDEPSVEHDLGPVDGRWYSPFPPLPALLATPLVAALARPALAFNLLVVAAALAAVWLAGRIGARLGGGCVRPWAEVAVASAILVPTALHDTYHSAHLLALLATLAALELAAHRRSALAGLALGLGALARLPVILGAPSLAALVRGGRPRWRIVAALGLGLAGPLCLYLLFNLARFGSPLETGYAGIAHHPRIAVELAAHGVFSLAYLPRNFGLVLAGLPRLVPAAPWIVPDPRGMALLLVAPWLVFALLPLVRPDRPGVRARAAWCWLAAATISVPHLLYVNSGWVQFGYRFALDELPFLLVAALLGVRRARPRAAVALLALSVAVNLWGLAALLSWERWSPLLG